MPSCYSGAFCALLGFLAATPAFGQSQQNAREPLRWSFSERTVDAGEDCAWKHDNERFPTLHIGGSAHSYIAHPAPEQDRAAWLAELLAYREAIRKGGFLDNGVADMDYQGVRAWMRLGMAPAKALALKPSETVHVRIEARWVSGANTVCFSFDTHAPGTDAKLGWTGINAAASVPTDGAWHELGVDITVPEFDAGHVWLRPIVGMDATHDATPGHVQLRRYEILVDDEARMAAVRGTLVRQSWDRSVYDNPKQQWLARAFTCHFTFMYDRSFYDPERGIYTLDAFLEDGAREFGGYDILLLWHAYPRIGVDERNQLDFYRDMPGGIPGIRDLVRQAHARDVRVFINYNPWDVGTSRTGEADVEFLAELVEQAQIDGIFLDTMFGVSPEFRARLEQARPGIALCPEGSPSLPQMAVSNGSWAQWVLDTDNPPGLLHRKWLEPRHMLWQIERWNPSHRAEIQRAFFNGSGMLVWENVFGAYNPWPREDRVLWKRASAILKRWSSLFASDAWDPFYPTLAHEIQGEHVEFYAHRWPGENETVFTLYCPVHEVHYTNVEWPLFETPYDPDLVFYDVWNGAPEPLRAEHVADRWRVTGYIDHASELGCVLAIKRDRGNRSLLEFLERQRNLDNARHAADRRNSEKPVLTAQPVPETPRVSSNVPPPGMVFVPGGKTRLHLTHTRRECGCYPDPDTAPDQWQRFLWGDRFDQPLTHDYAVDVAPYFIDETQVTNAQFKEFLDATGYRPKHPENFLKHGPNGHMTPEIATLPVVYVDIDDARAYARWAGKRLPTEPEWHRAAQGDDARQWPWGDTFDASRVNTTGTLMPARSLPDGRSPYGCYHMAGNAWELTESLRDDGHTRFLILRGGSYFKAEGSGWYFDGGPQPCNHHAKFILMGPGLDRCATVGFRCVVDVR